MRGYMRLKATRAMEEHMLLLLRTGEFLSKVYRLRLPDIFDQSLDWSKNRPKGVCPFNRMNIKKKKIAVTYIYVELWGTKDTLDNTLNKLEKDMLPLRAHLCAHTKCGLIARNDGNLQIMESHLPCSKGQSTADLEFHN